MPQGSIIGPSLLLIYINDICHVAKMSHLILFADDTNIFVADHNLNNFICNINYELQLITEWFQVNKLSLNVNKTNFVFFKYGDKNDINNYSFTRFLKNL